MIEFIMCHNQYYYQRMYSFSDIDDCNGATCFHNGSCVDGVNMFTCDCLPGYSGVDCRLDIDECASNPCNGGGTCIDQVITFIIRSRYESSLFNYS